MSDVATQSQSAVGTSSEQRPRDWVLPNCYVDLWMGALRHWQLDPVAGLAFTVTQDFEGDQFTFFKYPLDDLERLYGVLVQELAIYRDLEAHAVEQVRRNRLFVVEVDGFCLPDTKNSSYKTTHVKTTIGIDEIDPRRRQASYFHNGGRYILEGADYDVALCHHLAPDALADWLPPYVEVASRRFPALPDHDLATEAVALLRRHLQRAPNANPLQRYAEVFPSHVEELIAASTEYFHLYAFNTARQMGANFELLGVFLRWLEQRGQYGLESVAARCDTFSSTAKVMQFRLARASARRRVDLCEEQLDALQRCYEQIMSTLNLRFG